MTARIKAAVVAAWAAGTLAAPTLAAQEDAAGAVDRETPIVVASKPFAESYLLAEAFAQLLEASGYVVDRRPGLGMTELILGALIGGDIDVYPEYTGTGLAAVLGETAEGGSAAVFRRVSEEFEARWGVRWLPPLGFENTYAMAMRREVADSLDVRTLSGLAAIAPDLAGGFSPDFIGRPDGLGGLADAYGIHFRESRSLLQAVKYQALAENAVDVIDAYSTDGAISRYDLALLADDRNFFPPYEAAPLVSRELYADRPGAVLVLTRLAGRIDEEAVQRANERIEVEAAPIAVAARELLAEVGMIDAPDDEPGSASASRRTRSTVAALPGYMWTNRTALGRQFGRHVLLVLASLGAAILVALPAGVALERRRSLAEGTIRLSGLLQTIPGIALLAFMIPTLRDRGGPRRGCPLPLFAPADPPQHLHGDHRSRAGCGGGGTGVGDDRGTAARPDPAPPGGTGDHGRDPHGGGHQRGNRDARGVHRRGRTGGPHRGRTHPLRPGDDPVGGRPLRGARPVRGLGTCQGRDRGGAERGGGGAAVDRPPDRVCGAAPTRFVA